MSKSTYSQANCPICRSQKRKQIEKYLLKKTYDFDMYDDDRGWKAGTTRHHMKQHLEKLVYESLSQEIIEDKINPINGLENRVKWLEREFELAQLRVKEVEKTKDDKELRYVRISLREAEKSYYAGLRLLAELRKDLGATYQINLTGEAEKFKKVVAAVLVKNNLHKIWLEIKKELEAD